MLVYECALCIIFYYCSINWSDTSLGCNIPHLSYGSIIWALSQQNLSLGVCNQQMCRPACTSTQTDQHLCYLLYEKYHISTWFKRNFNFLACLCSWGDWFESHFVRNPEDRFCRVEAHILVAQLKDTKGAQQYESGPHVRVFCTFTSDEEISG